MSIVTVDFETYYAPDYSLSRMTTEEYVRDPRFQVIGYSIMEDGQAARWVTGTDREIELALKSYDWSDKTVLCHNTLFDGAIMGWRYGIQPKAWLDTLSMAQPIIGLVPGGSLAKLADHFELGRKGTEVLDALGKRRGDFTTTELAQYGRYCCNDTVLTRKLYDKLLPSSTPQELYIIDVMLRMYTDPVLELDQTVLHDHLVSVREKKAKLLARVEQLCGKDELMSNDKLKVLLESWGIDVPLKQNKNGEWKPAMAKTDEAFKALLEHEDVRVQCVVAARLGVKSTLEETRTESFIKIGNRGTLPIGLKYYGAHTGRASGQEKINPQNLPRGGALRRAIRAPNGYALVACDSAQIEARVVATLAGQHDLVQAFANGEDIYSLFASDVYNRPVDRKRVERTANGEEFKPDDEAGRVGKTSILGLGFGMGPQKFQGALRVAGVKFDYAECQRIVKLYRTKYDKINNLWYRGADALAAIMANKPFRLGALQLLCDGEGIHLPNGMLIRYPHLHRASDGEFYYCKDPRQVTAFVAGRLSGEDIRHKLTRIHGPKVIENVVQALARIVVFHQMCRIDQKMRLLDKPTQRRKVVLSAHDETVACVPAGERELWAGFMLEEMSRAPKWWPDLPIAAEVASGATYYDCK